MEKQEYESYYLRDFIYFALKGWRRIILFALIGAILFAGIALYRNRDRGSGEIDSGAVKPKSGVSLTDQELKAVNDFVLKNDVRVLRYTNRLQYLQNNANTLAERLSNSIFLSLDPDAQLVSSFDLVITMQNVGNEDSDLLTQRQTLLSLEYLKSARSNAFYADLEKINGSGISASNLRELVKVSMNDDKSIHFQLSAPDRDLLQRLSEAAKRYIEAEAGKQIVYPYPHNIEMTEITHEIVKNPEILESRTQIENDLNYLSSEILSVSEEYEQVFDEVLEEAVQAAVEKKAIDLAEQEIASKAGRARVSLPLYTAGGLIFAVLVALLWNFYSGSSSGKLIHAEDFARRTGLLFINEIFVVEEKKDKKKRLDLALDRYIEGLYLKDKIKESEPIEVAVSYAVSVIQGLNKTGDKAGEHIVALAADDRPIAEVLEEFNQRAAQSDPAFKILPLGESVNQISVIESIKTADSVIIFVRPRQSCLQNILRSLELIQELKKPVLGLISVEEVI